jgi:hypothetical protein
VKIQFDRETMPDELYNILLQHFVYEAVSRGYDVTARTQFEDWVISCDVRGTRQ